jgi:hypothetical protein
MPSAARQHDERADLPDESLGGTAELEFEPIILTARDWDAFLEEWDSNRPRPELEALVRRYREYRLSDVG